MVGRAEDDGVDIFVFEELAVIDVSLGFDAGFYALFEALGEDGGIDIADGDEAGAGQFVEIITHVAGALGIDANDGNADVAIGATGGGGYLAEEAGLTGEQGGATADEGGLEEFFAGPGFHGDNLGSGGGNSGGIDASQAGKRRKNLHHYFYSVGRG